MDQWLLNPLGWDVQWAKLLLWTRIGGVSVFSSGGFPVLELGTRWGGTDAPSQASPSGFSLRHRPTFFLLKIVKVGDSQGWMSFIQLNFLEMRVTGESEIRDSVLKLRGGGSLGAQLPTEQLLGAADSARKGRIFNFPFVEMHIWDFWEFLFSSIPQMV